MYVIGASEVGLWSKLVSASADSGYESELCLPRPDEYVRSQTLDQQPLVAGRCDTESP
jgi:hypothetical protein